MSHSFYISLHFSRLVRIRIKKVIDLIYNYFPLELKSAVKAAVSNSYLTEIRVRVNKPLVFKFIYGYSFINKDNVFTKNLKEAVTVSLPEIEEIVSLMSENSVYAYKDEMKNGFITLNGGHRAGLCGKYAESIGLKEITSLNIRIAREIKGVSDRLVSDIQGKNTIVIAPPGCGKTTYLRDLARNLSNSGITVGIVDERFEISPVKNASDVFDIGINTDVLRGIKKPDGMKMLLRTMNPDVIITDEIALPEDFNAVSEIINSGVKVVSSFHAGSIGEYREKLKLMGIDNDFFDVKILIDKSFEAKIC